MFFWAYSCHAKPVILLIHTIITAAAQPEQLLYLRVYVVNTLQMLRGVYHSG